MLIQDALKADKPFSRPTYGNAYIVCPKEANPNMVLIWGMRGKPVVANMSTLCTLMADAILASDWYTVENPNEPYILLPDNVIPFRKRVKV